MLEAPRISSTSMDVYKEVIIYEIGIISRKVSLLNDLVITPQRLHAKLSKFRDEDIVYSV